MKSISIVCIFAIANAKSYAYNNDYAYTEAYKNNDAYSADSAYAYNSNAYTLSYKYAP